MKKYKLQKAKNKMNEAVNVLVTCTLKSIISKFSPDYKTKERERKENSTTILKLLSEYQKCKV